MPTWLFLNSIPTSKRKPNSIISSRSHSPAYPRHAVTAETLDCPGRRVPPRTGQHVTSPKRRSGANPALPRLATADLLQHLWFDPPLVGSTQQDTEPCHHHETNGDPTQAIKTFFLIIMMAIILPHTQPTRLALQIQRLWTSTPAAWHLWRFRGKLLEMGAEQVRFLEGRSTMLEKKSSSTPDLIL